MLRRGGRPGLLGMAARTAVVAGTATAVSGAVSRHQEERAYQDAQQRAYDQQQQQADAAPPASAGGGADLTTQLTQLAALRDQGVLSDAEFAAAKSKLLG